MQIFILFYFLFILRDSPHWTRASSFTRFLDQTQRQPTVGRTPLDEWPCRRRDLYLTAHNTHNRKTSMPPVGFEPTFSASERPQTYALDRAATGTGQIDISWVNYFQTSRHMPVRPFIIGSHRRWKANLLAGRRCLEFLASSDIFSSPDRDKHQMTAVWVIALSRILA